MEAAADRDLPHLGWGICCLYEGIAAPCQPLRLSHADETRRRASSPRSGNDLCPPALPLPCHSDSRAGAWGPPAFQALMPDVLPDEADYTNALSLLRLAVDKEQVASPEVAAVLPTVVGFPILFSGTVAGFIGSALLVVTARLPKHAATGTGPLWSDVTKGLTRARPRGSVPSSLGAAVRPSASARAWGAARPSTFDRRPASSLAELGLKCI